MLNFFLCFIMSIMIGIGLAVVLVEKGNDWPIKPIRVRIQLMQSKIHHKLPGMLYCTTCTSFWTTLIADIVICGISFFVCGGFVYFLWPFSGFAAAGIAWVIIELINTLDKEQKINLILGDNEDKGE